MRLIPEVKNTIEIRVNFNDIYFIDNTKDKIQVYASDKSVIDLIKNIDGNRTSEELYNILKPLYKDITIKDVENTLKIMMEKELIINRTETLSEISENSLTINKDIGMFDRQILFWNSFSNGNLNGENVQLKLKNSHVLIVGLGGTGSWIALYLAQLGIENLTIVDYDYVTLSNLNRQVLYKRSDVGKLKTIVAKDRLLEVNPKMNITMLDFKLTNGTQLEQHLKGIHFVINCSDEPNVFATSKMVSKICMKYNIPHSVGGGYNHHLGMLGPTIIPFKSPCWGCFELQVKEPDWKQYDVIHQRSQKEAPSLNLISSFIASIQTLEIIKTLTDINSPILLGKKGEVDFNTLSINYEMFRRDPLCKMCGKKLQNSKEVFTVENF